MKIARNLFLLILGFLAISAIGGGIVLLLSPDGEIIGLPPSEFKNMPFDNFLIPGIILFTVLGIIPTLLVYALISKPDFKPAEFLNIYPDMHWSWTFSIYIAFILIGWIHIELIFLQGSVHWLQTFYLFYAILILLVVLLPPMRKMYKKED